MKHSPDSDPLFDQIPWVVFDSWVAIILFVLLLQIQLMQLMPHAVSVHAAAKNHETHTHLKSLRHR